MCVRVKKEKEGGRTVLGATPARVRTMELEELLQAPQPAAEAEVPVQAPLQWEIDITEELKTIRGVPGGSKKDGKMRMRRWFKNSPLEDVLLFESQRNIEILLSAGGQQEMKFTRGGVLMEKRFARLVLNKSCLGWEESDEVYLCLERDAKKTTQRSSGDLLACISTKRWQEKTGAPRQSDCVPRDSSGAVNTEQAGLYAQQPPAKRAKQALPEPLVKEGENFHVIALIRDTGTRDQGQVMLTNDQRRIFDCLYRPPAVEPFMDAADKWLSTFGAAPFVTVCEKLPTQSCSCISPFLPPPPHFPLFTLCVRSFFWMLW